MIKFSITFGFKNWLDFQFFAGSLLKCYSASRCSTYKFFKRKKRKKESHSSKWKVSKKQVFLKKYYLIRWRFFLKPAGLEFAFLNTWNLSLLSFFLFFVLISNTKRHRIIGICLKEWVLIWKIDVFGKGVKFWGTDEKSKKNNEKAFHPALKFYTLSFNFRFLRMLKRNYELRIVIYECVCCLNGKHLQKTTNHTA